VVVAVQSYLVAAGRGTQEAMGTTQITTSQRYLHWTRGLADSAAHGLPVEIA
jgi:hypothetical protein